YMIGKSIGNSVPFLLLPVMTRYLTQSDYGRVAMFQVAIVLTLPFVGLNLSNAITRNYFELDKKELEIYVSSCLSLIILGLIIVYIIYIIAMPFLEKMTEINDNWLIFVPLIAAMKSAINIILSIWRVKKQAIAFSLYNILITTINVLLSAVLVVVFTAGWKGRISGIAVSIILAGIAGIMILLLKGYIRPIIRKKYIKDAISIGVPLIPHVVSAQAKDMMSRLFLTRMVGVDATGLFTVGQNFGSVMRLFQGAFHETWIPWLFEKLKKGKTESLRKIVIFTYIYFILLLFMAFVAARIITWIIPFMVGKEFNNCAPYIIWIAFAMAADGMGKVVVGYIYFSKKTYLLSVITLASGLTNIGLNYILIEKNGAIGAAQAITITYFLHFLLTWILAMRIVKMPWILWRKNRIKGN
ncbi:MAG: oligosaccharide flippase family protein, partial [bacterium]|nr:oligosaccharide flippase family protein [bacterium]